MRTLLHLSHPLGPRLTPFCDNLTVWLAALFYLATFGLVYHTPLWTYFDSLTLHYSDYAVFEMLSNWIDIRMNGRNEMFTKSGFHQACDEAGLAQYLPKVYASLKDIEGLNKRIWKKPNRDGCGRGHSIVDLSVPSERSALLSDISEVGEYVFFHHWTLQEVLENSADIQRIQQSPHLSTFRVTTMAVAGSAPRVAADAMLRLAPKGEICDNSHVGGREMMFLNADGTERCRRRYDRNDGYGATTLPPSGFRIPKDAWEGIEAVATGAHSKLAAGLLEVGWDVALCRGGKIVLVEANGCCLTPHLHHFFRSDVIEVDKLSAVRIKHFDWTFSNKSSTKKQS